MSEPVTILDDRGEEHTYVISSIPSLKAVKMLSRFAEAGASSEFLDQFVNAAVESALNIEPDYDPVEDAINGAAHQIINNGDADLVADLLVHAERDGVQLTRAATEVAFLSNLGEMQRALALVIKDSFGGFFYSRVTPVRTWGTRLVGQALDGFQNLLNGQSINSALSGLSTKYGIGQKVEQV